MADKYYRATVTEASGRQFFEYTWAHNSVSARRIILERMKKFGVNASVTNVQNHNLF